MIASDMLAKKRATASHFGNGGDVANLLSEAKLRKERRRGSDGSMASRRVYGRVVEEAHSAHSAILLSDLSPQPNPLLGYTSIALCITFCLHPHSCSGCTSGKKSRAGRFAAKYGVGKLGLKPIEANLERGDSCRVLGFYCFFLLSIRYMTIFQVSDVKPFDPWVYVWPPTKFVVSFG